MRGHVRAVVGGILLSCGGVACLVSSQPVETVRVFDGGVFDPVQEPGQDGGGGTYIPGVECTVDSDCGSMECAQLHCVDHKCTPTNYPTGTAPTGGSVPPAGACQRTVCDGDGGLTTAPDPTAVSTQAAPACLQNACTAEGMPSFTADLANAPAAVAGSCTKYVCDADGGSSTEPDPTNVPAPTTCATYSCNDAGMAVSTPANPTAKCSALGFVCGADGTCGTCPTPDSACDEPGVGSRVSTSPYDFQGIGRTDSGGRYLCGAASTTATDYYTYYDDQTGFLATFDPYFEIEPTAPATMCAYFDCPSVTCPAGSTASSASGQPGCCLTGQPGAFTGMAIDFCDGARVTLKVTATSGCAGYELHFHD
jgi:hypothetical protein